MSFSLKLRLVVFALVTVVVLALAIPSALRLLEAKRKVSREVNEFASYRHHYLLIATNVPAALAGLNNELLIVATRHDGPAIDRFEQKSADLQQWIDHYHGIASKSKVVTIAPIAFSTNPGQLWSDIASGYSNYLDAAGQVIKDAAPGGDQGQRLAMYEHASQESQRMLELAANAQAQAEAIDLFLYGTNEWLPRFRYLGFAFLSLVALGCLCVFLAMGLFRMVVGIIRPLHKELDQRDTTIQLQKQLALRGEHAAAVAHEIRNPLTAISIRLHTLQRALLEGSAEHEDALMIRSEITRLNRIVENFLQLAKPATPELAEVSTPTALREVQQLFAPQLAKQSIDLKLADVVDVPVRADPYQLKQVLINLIKNAAESIGHNGLITLTARATSALLKNGATDVVIIEVHDNGPGIVPTVQDRLFEPFFSTKDSGTGLGLSIAWQIIDKHGGILDFVTGPIEGTVFRIVLPQFKGS